MQVYTQADVLRLAKRWQNSRRSYLLVNPLQAKHMPVSPARALEMMFSLGRQAAAHYPRASLVIGFAETATAIGAAVAECLGPDCLYITTTREEVSGAESWLYFQEEHSHAVEQKLCGDKLAAAIAQTEQIVFVDDEFSTGKTLLNMVVQLRKAYPEAEQREIAAASIINRLQPEQEKAWAAAGISSEYLVRPQNLDFERLAADIAVTAAEEMPEDKIVPGFAPLLPYVTYPDPRLGLRIVDYQQICRENGDSLAADLAQRLPLGGQILVLGTEECMYPALVLAAKLEQSGLYASVRCHATTRSPIGICPAADYPIQSGNLLPSFYEQERRTYIYNLAAYDAAVVLSDSQSPEAARRAQAGLARALAAKGCNKLFYIEGGRNVQHI